MRRHRRRWDVFQYEVRDLGEAVRRLRPDDERVAET